MAENKSYPDFLRVACHVLGRSGVETTREEVRGVLPRGGGVLTLDHEGDLLSVLFLKLELPETALELQKLIGKVATVSHFGP